MPRDREGMTSTSERSRVSQEGVLILDRIEMWSTIKMKRFVLDVGAPAGEGPHRMLKITTAQILVSGEPRKFY